LPGIATELRVALATCAELPEGDPDDAALVAALGAEGFDVSWRVWDEPGVDWGAFDAVVVRSTWDYQARRDEFLGWASRVPSLCNPAEILGWNTDKRYLAELGSSGIPVVETKFVGPGEGAPELPDGGELVVKPSVSAGSRDTARFAMCEPAGRLAALALLRSIHASGRTAMLQPYLTGVDAEGETALVYLDGAFSHSIRKGPLLSPGAGPTEDLFAEETIEPRAPTEAELALGGRVLATLETRFGTPVYARIDLAPADGGPVVLEVELTEPSLFFGHADGAAGRFVAALSRRISLSRA
jgi:glutathione synthase/RimK-type ligase-like ATP-grasp enzyme